jgi:hypothetical protein
VSSYNSIEVRKSLRLLKKMSCPGCEKCEWLWDFLNEDIWAIASPGENNDYVGNIKDGKIYTYYAHTSQGFEDLYPEIDCIEFVEVKDAPLH